MTDVEKTGDGEVVKEGQSLKAEEEEVLKEIRLMEEKDQFLLIKVLEERINLLLLVNKNKIVEQKKNVVSIIFPFFKELI